jgi:hypothetical protein
MAEAKLGKTAYHGPLDVGRTVFCWVCMFRDVVFLYRLRMPFRSFLFEKGSIDLNKLETAFNLYGPTARTPVAYACSTTQDDLDSDI